MYSEAENVEDRRSRLKVLIIKCRQLDAKPVDAAGRSHAHCIDHVAAATQQGSPPKQMVELMPLAASAQTGASQADDQIALDALLPGCPMGNNPTGPRASWLFIHQCCTQPVQRAWDWCDGHTVAVDHCGADTATSKWQSHSWFESYSSMVEQVSVHLD
jgi:hypothetical protein